MIWRKNLSFGGNGNRPTSKSKRAQHCVNCLFRQCRMIHIIDRPTRVPPPIRIGLFRGMRQVTKKTTKQISTFFSWNWILNFKLPWIADSSWSWLQSVEDMFFNSQIIHRIWTWIGSRGWHQCWGHSRTIGKTILLWFDVKVYLSFRRKRKCTYLLEDFLTSSEVVGEAIVVLDMEAKTEDKSNGYGQWNSACNLFNAKTKLSIRAALKNM